MKKMGRPKSDNPRNKRLEIKLTESEDLELKNLSENLKITRTAIILKGIDLVKKELDK
nr:MAG TPA: NikA, BACTERIAL CONJUGATION, RELAXASE, DNA [Caudoviricetes sp.]